MILTIILLSILSISLGYSTYNLLKKLELYEEQIEKSDEWLISAETDLKDILNKIEEIDSQGIFESDDEVGQTFNQIKDTIKSIEKLL